MNPARRAVIDVGTNSIKLLVAEVLGHHVHALYEESKQTRLGEDFYETQQLQRDAIYATAYFAEQFTQVARSYEAHAIRLIATSAARDAVNQADLQQALEQKTGLKLEIISGDLEAALSYQAVVSDPKLEGQRICLMEAGGGSAQFIVGEGAKPEFTGSFKLGALRLMEQFPLSDGAQGLALGRCREWLTGMVAQEVQPALGPVLKLTPKLPELIGAGGTAKSLLSMQLALNTHESDRLKSQGLPLAAVTQCVETLWRLPLSERKRVLGLKKKRADLMPFGAAIFEAAMSGLGFPRIRVSKRGLRHALLLEPGPAAQPG